MGQLLGVGAPKSLCRCIPTYTTVMRPHRMVQYTAFRFFLQESVFVVIYFVIGSQPVLHKSSAPCAV